MQIIDRKISEGLAKKFENALKKYEPQELVTDSYPNYTVIHFKNLLGWSSALFVKNKIHTVTMPKAQLVLGEWRLDIYKNDSFIISHYFPLEEDAIIYAKSHLMGYSNIFRKKINYNLTQIHKTNEI